LRVISWCHCH